MDQLLAWAVFPIAAVLVCFGTGSLAARLARVELAPALVPAVGFSASIALIGIVFATGIGAVPVCVLLVVLALAGLLAARPRMAPGCGASAGLAAYVLHIAPVALTGTPTFLGYNLLNDTAIHLALVDWIGAHGSRYLHQPPGSFGATINDYVESRYPLGSHELLAALKPIVGLDPALLYQPFLAVCAAIAAAAIYALLRRPLGDRAAAFAAFFAMASQLVFSFALQGSIKELAFIACLAAAAGLTARMRADRAPHPPSGHAQLAARHPAGGAALLALPAIALYGIYGIYAMPWIVPIAVVGWLAARPPLRAVGAGLATFLIGVAVLIPDSIHYYNHGHETITSGTELGPLAGSLKFIQVAGVWLGGDYRFPPNHSWISYLLAAVVLGLAAFGLLRALVRRRAAPLLFAIPALFAYVVTSPSSSPYIDAKLLAILSPAVIVAAAVGLAAMPRPRAALAVAFVLGIAVLVSDALAYRVALPAPIDRLDELGQIDARFAGQGPILVNEYEEYVKHFMRRSPGSDPYETWTAARAQLHDPTLKVAAHQYDLDQMKTAYVERFTLIALRRSPAASRPPSNYDRVWTGRWYDVWRRVRPAPVAHVALGKPPFDPTAPVECRLARRLGGHGASVVAAVAPRPLVIPLAGAQPLPPGWYVSGQDPGQIVVNKGGQLVLHPAGLPTGLDSSRRATFWLRGRTTRAAELLVGGRAYPIPRAQQRFGDWIQIATVRLGASMPSLELRRPTRSLRPGDAQPDVIGPLVAVADRPSVVVPAMKACGAPADWIDVTRR